MFRVGLLFLTVFIAGAQGQATCGCPYKPKGTSYGAQYDPSRLAVMETSDKSCAITCENGYMLENRADYVECTNGVKWLAQNRDNFGTGGIVDNPFLTCIKSTPKTCPPGTWTIFACKNCDASKIMVAPSAKGECTIMCDKGFRLVGNKGGSAITRLAEATLKSGNWVTYALGSISTSESAPAASSTFNCELIPGTKPKPPPCGCTYDFLESDDYEWAQLTASSDGPGTCRVACQTGYSLVSDSASGMFPSATCTRFEWTTQGKGDLNSVTPKFSCKKSSPEPESGCKRCSDSLIKISTSGAAARPMTATTDTSGVCAVRTFVCEGPNPLATIEVNGGANGVISDDKRVTFSVNCNSAGTAWTSCGKPVTQLQCSSALKPSVACQRCSADLIKVTTTGSGAKPMTADTTDTSEECAVRTFVCRGTKASIEINTKGGVIEGKNGQATLSVHCNEDGTAWTLDKRTVSRVECSSSP